MLSTVEKKEVKDLLDAQQNIVLTTHTNPDGDAIGSSLAMLFYLRKKGHHVTAMIPNHFPGFLHWLPGSQELLVYEREAKKVQQALDQADLMFCLDYNALARVGGAYDVVKRCPAKRILIDHHIDPETESFDYLFSTTDTSSTGELVYDFISLMGDKALIDKEIAENLYTCIMTDTGSFSFASNNEKTYNVTADLIGLGVDAEKIHRLVYDTFSENRLRLLGHAISQRLIIWDELHVALIYLTREDLREFHYQVGDAEGVVNYPLMMEKINVSVLLSERDNQIRISFRSKGDFSVNEVARKFFKGGGHRNAAGGKSFVSMDKTIKSIKEVLEQYRDSLDYKISY
jgi:phosphoesterase RecJ-like protein